MIKRTSPIWLITKNDLQELINRSNSFVEVIKSLGLPPYNGNHKTLHQRIKEDNISINKLEENRKQYKRSSKKIDISSILINDSLYKTSKLKDRLIKEGLLEYKCFICNNPGEWNSQKLSLQLDHINGINNDHTIENLRILCPNCHSQTDTYSGKNNKKETVQNKCLDCNCDVHKDSFRCVTCSNKNNKQPLKFEVTKQDLQELINKYPMIQIGKMFGVSNNAVKKRCIKLGIQYNTSSK